MVTKSLMAEISQALRSKVGQIFNVTKQNNVEFLLRRR